MIFVQSFNILYFFKMTVTFRVLVFRPFIEEVLTGRIKSSTKEGVTLNLGFFDDIFLPASNLQHPCRFDESDQGMYL